MNATQNAIFRRDVGVKSADKQSGAQNADINRADHFITN